MATQLPVKVPTLQESLSRVIRLPEDIKLIREKEGLGLTQMARSLGVTKECLWYWQTGKHVPREPLIVLILITWGEKLRNQAQ